MKVGVCILTGLALLSPGCMNSPRHPAGLPLRYENEEYGFSFFLPATWRGYSVLLTEWEGTCYSPAKNAVAVTARGPMIVFRHPQWRADDPYQDLPILVFTRSQWDSDKLGRFGIGAGGLEYELWHTPDYVFGISSRYNADDSVKGFKEAAEVVEWNRAANSMPRLYPE